MSQVFSYIVLIRKCPIGNTSLILMMKMQVQEGQGFTRGLDGGRKSNYATFKLPVNVSLSPSSRPQPLLSTPAPSKLRSLRQLLDAPLACSLPVQGFELPSGLILIFSYLFFFYITRNLTAIHFQPSETKALLQAVIFHSSQLGTNSKELLGTVASWCHVSYYRLICTEK